MRAIVANDIGPPEDLIIEELPDPVPGPGEVLVDIRAAAVNFPDLLVIEASTRSSRRIPSCRARRAPGWSRRSARASTGCPSATG